MRVVRSVSELVSLLRYFSANSECGSYVKFVIPYTHADILSKVPRYAMANDLSLIDIEEVSGGFVVSIVNRFGRRCDDKSRTNSLLK